MTEQGSALDREIKLFTNGGSSVSYAQARRNDPLLAGYEYDKYPGNEAITGFNNVNLQRINVCRHVPAVRTRVGPRGNFKGTVCVLADGSLVLAACRRITKQGLFGIHVYTSADKGLTWTEIGQTKLYGKEGFLTAVPDGSLLMTGRSEAVPGRSAPPSDWAEPQQTTQRSTDGGRTWQTIKVDGLETPRNIIVETDGSLLMIRALRSGYHEPYSPSGDLELLRSANGGQNWTHSEGRVDWDNSSFGEVASVRLGDGRLLAALRGHPQNLICEGRQVTFLTESSDDGKTWCRPWVITNTAEVQVQLLLLRSGRLLATYTNYHLPYGACAIVSEDDGRTWSCGAPIQLAISADCFTGWATTVELADGDLLTSYMITAYQQQPPEQTGTERSVCEVVRWRLPDLR